MHDPKHIQIRHICGCFSCLRTFAPSEITQWIDLSEESGVGQMALCPYCGIDTVVKFPEEYHDIDGYLKRRNQQDLGGNTYEETYDLDMLRTSPEDTAWPIVIVGAFALAITAMFILSGGAHQSALNPLAFPVTLPAILIGKGLAICIAPVFFIIYNLCILRLRMAKVTWPGFAVTGIFILVIGTLSTLQYVSGWKFRDVYVDAATVDAWAIFNFLIALTTLALFVKAVRQRTPQALAQAHIALFLWFNTYAFPWLGEMI